MVRGVWGWVTSHGPLSSEGSQTPSREEAPGEVTLKFIWKCKGPKRAKQS